MPGGGAHPADADLFGDEQLAALRAGVVELTYLRARGYGLKGALKLVGDRHQLRERQRTALSRATSQAETAAGRRERRAPDASPAPNAVWIDGFNQVITCETALNGGVLVTTLDGGLRDLAGVHGSYRLNRTTDAAIALLDQRLAARGWADVHARWLLDAPVSNTGRLAARIRALAEANGRDWTVEVVPDPDPLLAAAPSDVVVASGDAVILDGCHAWVDLAAEAVRAGVPDAWIVDLALG